MWVCWSNFNITVLNHFSHERLVHLNILYKPHNKMYSILGTYCPAQNNKKYSFWTYLNNYVTTLAFPWLMLGDFNEMLSLNDKIGGCPLKQHQLLSFPLFLTNSQAIDIPCLQQAFSWRGNHSNAIIYERLDKALFSMVTLPFPIMRQLFSLPMKRKSLNHLLFDSKIFGH